MNKLTDNICKINIYDAFKNYINDYKIKDIVCNELEKLNLDFPILYNNLTLLRKINNNINTVAPIKLLIVQNTFPPNNVTIKMIK